MEGPQTRCATCEDLLSKLSAASEHSFRITSELSYATLSGETGSTGELLRNARIQRAECDSIRKALEEHWANGNCSGLAVLG